MKSKVVKGSDGWLFMQNDSNDVIGQFEGRVQMTLDSLELWFEESKRRKFFFEKNNCLFSTLVIPTKHYIYPEKINLYKESLPSPAEKIKPIYAKLDSPYIYPKSTFLNKKVEGQIYHKSDSHLSDFGTYLAYKELVDALKCSNLNLKNEFNLVSREEVICGDLGRKLSDYKGEKIIKLESRDFTDIEFFNNGIENIGNYRLMVNKKGSGSCIVFGNSFSNTFFLSLLASNFKSTFFWFSPTIDESVIKKIKPILVIHQLAERFLLSPPRDLVHLNSRIHGLNKLLLQKENNNLDIQFKNNSLIKDYELNFWHDLFKAVKNKKVSKKIFNQSKLNYMQKPSSSHLFTWSLLFYRQGFIKKSLTLLRHCENLDVNREFQRQFLRYSMEYPK